jgi:hypothetical protein
MLGHNLHIFNVKNEHCILRNLLKLRITITQMRTRSKSARATGAHPLKTISKTGNNLSVANCPNLIAVSGNKISAIEMAIISEPHPVALLQLRASAKCLLNNLDASLWHKRSLVA